MSDVIDDQKGTQTPPAPSAEPKNNQPSSPSGDGSGVTDKNKGDQEPMIPKHRFDEVAEKARLGERALQELDQLKSRISSAFGGNQNDSGASDEIRQLANKYGVQDEFIKDILSVGKTQARREFENELKPLKAQQAHALLEAEFANLEREIPEAKDMSFEEREDLKKLALDKRYHNVPLVDVWKMKNFGKTPGKKTTAEPSRGGARQADDGEVDIKSMSIEEFEKYSNSLAKKK